MLKTVETSGANKTEGIAVTYRAGKANKYDTCPTDCKLNNSGCGTNKIDLDYLLAELRAVPRKGKAFGYTHYSPLYWRHLMTEKTATLNWSADSISDAVKAVQNEIPAVTVVHETYWQENGNPKHASFNGCRLIRCVAEYLPDNFRGCADCGGGDPLCARQDRDYVILFSAHGSGKKKINNGDRGGCYADTGPAALHWQATAESDQDDESDGEKLIRFAKGLRAGSILRNRIAGDLGLEQESNNEKI